MHRCRRALAALVVLGLLASAASATWSIVIVDTRTGEVAVGTCTCLVGFDIRAAVPVILVGKGAGAAQSYVDVSGQNRLLIRNSLQQGIDPQQILAALAAQDPGHQTRQYGIVDVLGRAATFSGTGAGAWAGGVTGQIGTLVYAIQGNILTGSPVVAQAELAVRNTPGDLAEKLMAGMQAARAMGGDGRCSCSPGNPTGCGAPPASFTWSSYIGCMQIARQGDTDGQCNTSVGCASGIYYQNFNVLNNTGTGPDPVFVLQGMFNAWRTQWLNRPDHHLSDVTFNPPSLVPDGASQSTATLVLRNWQGVQLPISSAIIVAYQDPGSTVPITVGTLASQGNGVWTFPVTAGTVAGDAKIRILVSTAQGTVLLSPRSTIPVRADPLWASTASFRAVDAVNASFLLNAGPAAANRAYALAGSNSGSVPGFGVPPALNVPLNPDPFFFLSVDFLNSPFFPNTLSTLGPSGTAAAGLVLPPLLFGPLAGTDLTFAYVLLNPVDFASNPVTISVLP